MPICSSSTMGLIKMYGYCGSAAIFAYLDIEQTQITILATLMVMDFFFWIIREFIIDRSNITSHKAWLWLFKKVSTLLLTLSIWLVFKWIQLDGSDYIQWMLWIFIMAEGYSISRSVYAIRTGKMLPEYDVISITIKNIGDFIINMIDKKK